MYYQNLFNQNQISFKSTAKMNNRIIYILLIATLISFVSGCEKDDADEWYVHYVAIPTDKADMNKEHDSIVTLPWGYDEKFLFKGTYDQIYGPFQKGTRIWFLVDTPHLDTYDVQLWISHERKDFQLACAGKNQIDLVLP